ncbi:HEAT repeat domain-containing protein [Streptomyces sp. NBC_01264]|uniref:HEAT repeat domain-containing protein n=1 Tax=Streptomyces sp. NBC_01264 TaxID=2903804 RepID=UPI00224D9793|nr:HEAT repeat domain-containing protein [Streptomyces sp. NBC_01264]MCX4780242.1 HEAT repeat domain-containing protein [Streptomyces sp. NBC_01264]
MTDPDEAVAALCAAVEAYEDGAAGELVGGGADPDRVLPDGTTPLLRAVEGGSPAVVTALLGEDARLRLPEAEQGRLMDAARRWYEAGAEAELRRLTGSVGPADTVWVTDSEYEVVPETALGGRKVRAGHGAVLTLLEWEFRILAPVAELVARGVRSPRRDHVDRSASLHVLNSRVSAQTWGQAVAFRHDPDPRRRAFVVDHIRYRMWSWSDTAHAGWYEKECNRILTEWEAEETDADVLGRVLDALGETEVPTREAIGLRRAGHPDPGVRRWVPGLLDRFGEPLSPEGRRALRVLCRDGEGAVRASAAVVLAREEPGEREDLELLPDLLSDPDPEVVRQTAYSLGSGALGAPGLADLLVRCLDADDPDIRLSAAYALAVRDDPRTPEAYAKVGPLGPEYEHDHRPGELLRWRWRRNPDPA